MLKISDIHKWQVLKFVFKCINILALQQIFMTCFNSIMKDIDIKLDRISMDSGTIIKNLVIPFARTTHYGIKQKLMVLGCGICYQLISKNFNVCFLEKSIHFRV